MYYLQSTTVSTAVETVRGTENKVNTTISFRIAFKVTSAADTCYTLEAHYQSLSMKIRLADTTLTMNSGTDSKTDTPSRMMAKIINKPFIIKMTSGGKVKTIESPDKLIASAFGDFSW